MEEIRKLSKRLKDIRADVLKKYPFFGRILMRINLGIAHCSTAYTDMKYIVFDPDFASELDDEQVSFVMIHEVMHCVLKHCTRGIEKRQRVYNIACDIVVNSIILEALGKEEFSILGENVMHLTPEGKEGREYSADQIYDMLMEKTDEELENEYGGDFDEHKWEKLLNDPMIESIWDQYVKSAAGCGSGSGVPDSVRRVIEAIEHKPKIEWKQVLHDYLQFDRGDYVFSPPDRRFSGEFILPSYQDNVYGSSVENVWFLVDTSGSVNSREISEAFWEIKDAIEAIDNFQGYLSFFDAKVSEPVEFSFVDDIDNMIPVGGGGTSFIEIFKYLKTHFSDLPKVIIIITDGYAMMPDEEDALGVPVIWLIVDSKINPPFGEVLNIYTK